VSPMFVYCNTVTDLDGTGGPGLPFCHEFF
jgi:hypothetical protein